MSAIVFLTIAAFFTKTLAGRFGRSGESNFEVFRPFATPIERFRGNSTYRVEEFCKMMRTARFILFVILALIAPRFAAAGPAVEADQANHASHAATSPTLIDEVRQITEPFRDISALPEDYKPALGCVSGPQEGAMGVHYVNFGILFDGEVLVNQPEAVIYEFKDGVARLVGVEYIVIASDWEKTHTKEDVPILGGQLLHFNESPNRFGLPAFYELHVWAWRENPHGAFVDWNPLVSCEGR